MTGWQWRHNLRVSKSFKDVQRAESSGGAWLGESVRSAGSDRVQGLQSTPNSSLDVPLIQDISYCCIAHRTVTVTQRCSVTNCHFCDLHRVACHHLPSLTQSLPKNVLNSFTHWSLTGQQLTEISQSKKTHFSTVKKNHCHKIIC